MKAILLSIALAVCAAPPAAAQEATPLATVREVMTLELWSLSSAPGGDLDPFSETSLDQNFTPEFAAAYRAVVARMEERNEPLIDGDLILNSQEYCPLKDLSLEERAQSAEAAEVSARFKSSWCFPEAGDDIANAVTEAVFRLVRRDGRWLIDDLDSGGSTRALLEQLMSE